MHQNKTPIPTLNTRSQVKLRLQNKKPVHPAWTPDVKARIKNRVQSMRPHFTPCKYTKAQKKHCAITKTLLNNANCAIITLVCIADSYLYRVAATLPNLATRSCRSLWWYTIMSLISHKSFYYIFQDYTRCFFAFFCVCCVTIASVLSILFLA